MGIKIAQLANVPERITHPLLIALEIGQELKVLNMLDILPFLRGEVFIKEGAYTKINLCVTTI